MKRILSGIFAALLILCVLPVAAFAEQQPSDIDPITVQPIGASGGEIVRPTWLAYGPITQYPAEGGTWEYGFWDAKVRSYYTVDRCHGSTVVLNGNTVRSVDCSCLNGCAYHHYDGFGIQGSLERLCFMGKP